MFNHEIVDWSIFNRILVLVVHFLIIPAKKINMNHIRQTRIFIE